mmetsp:Transcript_12052/g.19373  ORF Transcript_12052/g.19373 Transcript_12052/m.19373 type:complete len:282 (+) Transcript_12052:18-863(+)
MIEVDSKRKIKTMILRKRQNSFNLAKLLASLTVRLLAISAFSRAFSPNYHNGAVVGGTARPVMRKLSSTAQQETQGQGETVPGQLTADSIYFDIEVANQPVGRLIFHLTNPSPLPLHAENVIQLAKGSRRGIDPKAHYVGCEFDYNPASVEDGMGRYRWGHQLRGRGRNAVGLADRPISDPDSQLRCTHPCFGGQYYGDKYTEKEGDPGVFLTVPVAGPGYGSSKFSIVRVGESPKEWKERLLVNSGVIGKLDPSCLETLHAMARQRMGPPTVVAAGAMEE